MHACMHCTTGIIDECAWQVLGGADLFLQGLIVPPGGLGDFSAGDVRAVAIPQNPFPFAVRGLESGSLNPIMHVIPSGSLHRGWQLRPLRAEQGGEGPPCQHDPAIEPVFLPA